MLTWVQVESMAFQFLHRVCMRNESQIRRFQCKDENERSGAVLDGKSIYR